MILGLSKKTTTSKPDPATVQSLYGTAIALARAPVFYHRFAVPDTVDGRFDLLTLMLSLFLFRTQQVSPETAQAVFDLAFRDMERGLREAGIGDLSVPKQMKKMLEAFYGRSALYYDALEQRDVGSLTAVLIRNLYNGSTDAPAGSMAEWVNIIWTYMAQLEPTEFLNDSASILQLIPSSPHSPESARE
jgi:cytochrome b pre-mRNA-processing protein 3